MDENLPVTPGTAHRDDSFDIAVRGYNRQQVMEYMSRSSQLLANLEQHLAVARADVHRARAEAEQAQAEVARLRSEQAETKPVHEEVSGRLSQILRLAAEEADQERATAEAEIAALHSESKAEAERLISEARAEAEAGLTQARETADRELSQARAAAERDVGAAREEADRLKLVSVRQADELLDDAQRRAGAINEVSNQRLETLTATHGEAVLRLGQIRDVLADLLDRDAAAGSLAQVVEAVIAPAGSATTDGVDSDQTTVQPPVDQTVVAEAIQTSDSGPVVVGAVGTEAVAGSGDDADDAVAAGSAEPTARPAVAGVRADGDPAKASESKLEVLPITPSTSDDAEIDLRDHRPGRVVSESTRR
jgi:cell division septum initiation protein DivIVA